MKTYTSPSLAKRCPPTMDPYTYSANVAHPYTPVGMAFNFPVPPAPHISSCAPPPIQRREESEPRVGSHLSKKMRKKCAATSSSSRRRPHGRKAPNAHSRANLVTENLHSDRVLISITERSTIPACVYLATSGGVDPTSIGII
jgi:hypothetical protein